MVRYSFGLRGLAVAFQCGRRASALSVHNTQRLLKSEGEPSHSENGQEKPASTSIESLRHRDKRKNIPTEELREFPGRRRAEPAASALSAESGPRPATGLARQGRARQPTAGSARRADLHSREGPSFGHHRGFSPNLGVRRLAAAFQNGRSAEGDQARPESQRVVKSEGKPSHSKAQQLDLFSDFNGLPDDFHDRVDFYHHEANWQNRLILGNSLLVMTSLAEKETLARTRLMSARFPCYLLADTPEGRKKSLGCGDLSPLSNRAEAEEEREPGSESRDVMESEGKPSHSKGAD